MNYIITKHPDYFSSIGKYNFCTLDKMILPDTIAIDTETTGLLARKEDIFCIQIGTGTNNYIIKMYENDYIFKDIIPFIKDKTLLFHNALFDLGFFYKHNYFPEKIKDTFIQSKILYNGENERNDLKTVYQREMNITLDKLAQKNISTVKLSQPSTINYSFLDVNRLLDLHAIMQKKIIKGEYEATYNLHCEFVKVLAYIEQCGMPINPQKWKDKMEEDNKNALLWSEKIEEYIYDTLPKFIDTQLNLFDEKKKIYVLISSPSQMLKVFQTLNIPTKDKEGKDSINENVISNSRHEFVPMWLAYQEAQHRVSTFGENIYNQIENNRIYTNFNIAVDTARLSTRKGNINFLNFPSDKLTRNCFETSEENVMIVCDYSMQEGIILTDLSGDKAMMASVLDGIDLHCLLTRKLYKETENLTDDEIKTLHNDKRQQAKISRFALSYGAQAFTLHKNQNIPLEEAINIEKAFKELHKDVYIWGNEIYEQSIKTGYITSADGWKLKLSQFDEFCELKVKIEAFDNYKLKLYKEGKDQSKKKIEAEENNKKYIIKDQLSYDFYKRNKSIVSKFYKLRSEYQRLCLNNPIQSEGSHMTKRAMCLFFQWIKENNLLWKVKICNMIHDEAVVECEDFLKDITKENLSRCMVEGGNYYLKNLTIKAEANYNRSWGKAK